MNRQQKSKCIIAGRIAKPNDESQAEQRATPQRDDTPKPWSAQVHRQPWHQQPRGEPTARNSRGNQMQSVQRKPATEPAPQVEEAPIPMRARRVIWRL